MDETMGEKRDNAREEARAQYDSIAALVLAFKQARGDADREEADRAICENALEVTVRSGWHDPSERLVAEEFQILLATGGPAARIVGELNDEFQPVNARLEHQDWGTPWTEFGLSHAEESILLVFCTHFYFGEG